MASQSCPIDCFVAGTLVHTRSGPVPIEQIKVGDVVLSHPDQGGEPGYKRVVNTSVRQGQAVIRVIFGSDEDPDTEYSLFVTVDHPFWVEGVGWAPASRLRPASVLRLADGTFADVLWVRPVFRTDRPNVGVALVEDGEEGVGREIDFDDMNYLDDVDIDESLLDGTDKDPHFRTTVHNLDVEDFHTCHVGKAGVLVRAADCK